MDRNIAALLREDARTVQVVFLKEDGPFVPYDPENMAEVVTEAPPSPRRRALNAKSKSYTYVTHFPLAVGDVVIVEAGGEVKMGSVVSIDDEVKIEPNSTIEYKWIVAKIDMAAHAANMDRNAKIEMSVADAYRKNLRRSFAQSVLLSLEGAQRAEVEQLLK